MKIGRCESVLAPPLLLGAAPFHAWHGAAKSRLVSVADGCLWYVLRRPTIPADLGRIFGCCPQRGPSSSSSCSAADAFRRPLIRAPAGPSGHYGAPFFGAEAPFFPLGDAGTDRNRNAVPRRECCNGSGPCIRGSRCEQWAEHSEAPQVAAQKSSPPSIGFFSNNLQGTNQGVPPSWQPCFVKDPCRLKTATRGDTAWRHERRRSHSLPGTLSLLWTVWGTARVIGQDRAEKARN